MNTLFVDHIKIFVGENFTVSSGESNNSKVFTGKQKELG